MDYKIKYKHKDFGKVQTFWTDKQLYKLKAINELLLWAYEQDITVEYIYSVEVFLTH